MEHWKAEIRVDRPRKQDPLLRAGDFGARPIPDFDNTPAFRSALCALRAQGGGTLHVPAGTYHLFAGADGVHLPLRGLRDVTLRGEGAELIFHAPVAYFDIEDCERLLLCGLTLDWAWEEGALASVGIVRSLSEDGRTLIMDFPGDDPLPDPFEIRIVGPFDPLRYTPGCAGGVEFRPYENLHFKRTGDPEADAAMRLLVRELDRIFAAPPRRVGDRTLAFDCADPMLAARIFQPGACFNFRHFEYDGVAVRGTRCSHVTLEDLMLYGCPGHGFLFNGDVHHLRFNRCVIRPRPGTLRSISVSVDCLHVGNSLGDILIEHCDFQGAGDDCVNLHDNSSMGAKRVDDHTLLAARVSEGSLHYRPGSQIELRAPDLSPLGFIGTVTACRYDEAARTCLLTFDERLPEALPRETVLFHRSFHTDRYIIRRCRFSNNRARGLLLQGSHGLVEENILENIQGAAIQIETGCENRWSEGQGVRDLLIRGNVIRHCDLNAWQMAVLYMGVYLPGGRTDYPIFEDIEICENTLVDCPREAAFLSSCRNVSVHDNAILNAAQMDYERPQYGSSTMEAPIYGERYAGILQFAHATQCTQRDNRIFCLKIPNEG